MEPDESDYDEEFDVEDYEFSLDDDVGIVLEPIKGDNFRVGSVEMELPKENQDIRNRLYVDLRNSVDWTEGLQNLLDSMDNIDSYDLDISSPDIHNIILNYFVGNIVIPESRIIQFPLDGFSFTVDGRSGIMYRKIDIPNDVAHKIVSGLSIGLFVGMTAKFLEKYVVEVISTFMNGKKVCVKVSYHKRRFVWIMIYPKIAGVIHDERLTQAIFEKKRE